MRYDGGFTWVMIDIGEKYVTLKRYLGGRTNRAQDLIGYEELKRGICQG